MTWYKNSEGRHGKNGAKGDSGEEFVKEYFEENNILYSHRTDIQSQVKMKIDFLIYPESITMDVKTNAFKDYLALEIETDKNKPGWLYTSTAEEIYGVDLEKEEIYKYKLSEMREYAEKNTHRFKKTKKGAVLLWVHKENKLIERLQ
jgi:hypothetical protein